MVDIIIIAYFRLVWKIHIDACRYIPLFVFAPQIFIEHLLYERDTIVVSVFGGLL